MHIYHPATTSTHDLVLGLFMTHNFAFSLFMTHEFAFFLFVTHKFAFLLFATHNSGWDARFIIGFLHVCPYL